MGQGAPRVASEEARSSKQPLQSSHRRLGGATGVARGAGICPSGQLPLLWRAPPEVGGLKAVKGPSRPSWLARITETSEPTHTCLSTRDFPKRGAQVHSPCLGIQGCLFPCLCLCNSHEDAAPAFHTSSLPCLLPSSAGIRPRFPSHYSRRPLTLHIQTTTSVRRCVPACGSSVVHRRRMGLATTSEALVGVETEFVLCQTSY